MKSVSGIAELYIGDCAYVYVYSRPFFFFVDRIFFFVASALLAGIYIHTCLQTTKNVDVYIKLVHTST